MRTASTPRPAPALRRRRVRVAAAVFTGAAALMTVTGCAGLEYSEAVCSNGEYPVLYVGSTGSACVPDKEEPPAGYSRYPEGKVPKKVDDTWDVYWRTHTLDKNGKIIDAE